MKLKVRIESKCHHCSKALTIDVDDQLKWTVRQAGASPLLFEPDVAWSSFHGANIIHDY